MKKHTLSLKNIFLPACAGMLLSACSMLEFAYNHVDWIIAREIDTYFDLNPTQKTLLKYQLGIQLEEHRRILLPRYTYFLDQLSEHIQDGLSHDEIQTTLEHFKILYSATVTMMIDLLAPLMTTLSAEQIQHLQKRMEKVNRAQQEEHNLNDTPQNHYKFRIKRNIKRVKYWAGSVSDNQREIIRDKTQMLPDTYKLWYKYNITKQEEMLTLLEQNADAERIKTFLIDWWIKSAGKDPEFEKLSLHESAMLIAYIKAVDDSLDSEQRQHVIKRLRYFFTLSKKLALNPQP